jgi:hypothetical protein
VFDEFKKSWLEEISKIENRAIDSEGVYRIYLQYMTGSLMLHIDRVEDESTRDFRRELTILESKLVVALETARSKYRLQNRGLWARIIEGIAGTRYRFPRNHSRQTES